MRLVINSLTSGKDLPRAFFPRQLRQSRRARSDHSEGSSGVMHSKGGGGVLRAAVPSPRVDGHRDAGGGLEVCDPWQQLEGVAQKRRTSSSSINSGQLVATAAARVRRAKSPPPSSRRQRGAHRPRQTPGRALGNAASMACGDTGLVALGTTPAVGQSFPAERLGISLTRRLPTPPDRPSHHARPGPLSFFKHPSSAEQI